MNETEKDHPHTHYKKDHGHRPYWKRAHHDWKFWIALLLMLFAIGVYVWTNDLSLRPHAPIQQQVP